MLRNHHSVWRWGFILVDIAVSASVFIFAYWLRFFPTILGIQLSDYGLGFLDSLLTHVDPVPSLNSYLQVLPALAIALWITNSYFRLYQPRRTSSFLSEMSAVIKANFIVLLLLLTFFFFSRNISWSRSVFLIFAVLNPIALILFRLSIRATLRSLRAKGYNLRSVWIVGTGRTAQELITRFRDSPWTGIRIEGLISISPDKVGDSIHGIPILGSVENIYDLSETHDVDQVYLALPSHERELLERLVHGLTGRFIAVRIVPDIGYYLAPNFVTDFEGLAVVAVWENRPQGWDAMLKRGLDIAVAFCGIVCCLPLFVAIACTIKATSRGPIFYTQMRMGLDGRLFRILKFRTMHLDADKESGWTKADDNRCTRFGAFLRRTSLDELPQLFNVLLGQMSLVGPRPERPHLIDEFRKRFPRYMLRHQVKAGITGWAQVNGWRGDTSLRKRLQYDLYYMRHWSIWFDIKIIVLTFIRGLIHPNAY